MPLLASVLLALPGALLAGLAGVQIRRGLPTRHWPVVSGRIGSRAVDERWVGDLPEFRPRVTYSYQVGNEWFSGRRIQFGSPRVFTFPGWARDWLGKSFPEGTSVSVAYNPERPDEAVLKPGVSPWTYGTAAVGCVLAVAGALLGSTLGG